VSDLIGRQIGAYIIDRQLGAGGMGTVFAGHNIHSQQQVAIKIMRGDVIQPSFRQRFLQEAQAIARLDHPNIVKIYHFDEHAGTPYLVIELVSEGSLRGLLQRYAGVGRLPPLPLGLGLALQATHALAYAHARGIIHRDVKPDNMLLQREADPSSGPPRFVLKLSDFGLARLVQGVALTMMSGAVMGTPQYMSPEQCQGQPVDARTDIYALGVVLYELTTGYLPFNGPTAEAVLEKQVKTPPPSPRQQRAQMPEDVEAIILRCLAKAPEDRFATASDLASAIQGVLQQPGFATHYSVKQQQLIATPAPSVLVSAPRPSQPQQAPASGGGRQIGHYQITTEQPVGGGGMGQVFRARDTRDGRIVALKLVYPNLAADPKVRQRFQRREAQIAQRLKHPHIVEVYEAGEANGQLYMAMELLEDGSLRSLLERRATKPWPLTLGLELVRQASDGLAAAHAQGIVHRDIKPDNLLLRKHSAAPASPNDLLGSLLGQANVATQLGTERYDLKVSDFGVAALTDGTRMTSTGTQVGTHAYMSPEQCSGKPVDPRADIYALGVVLYELATGTLPFQIDNPGAAMYQILFTTPPPPRMLNPALPAEVEAIIQRCMAREPDNRFASAADLSAALQHAISAMGSQISRMAVPAPQSNTIVRGAEHIYVSLDRSTLTITPGQPESLSATVRNLGAQTDHFDVRVSGAAGWVSPDVQALQLNPNAGGTATFTITVPRAPESRAGDYDVTVSAESRTVTPGDAGLAQARWTVVEFKGNQLEINPRIVNGRDRARYRLRLRNDGNAPARYTLRGEDDLNALAYTFQHGDATLAADRPLALEPGASADVQLMANAPRRLFGSPQAHNLRVELKGGSQPKLERVQFNQRALLPTWVVSVLVPLLLALCAGGGLGAKGFFIDRPAAATATALAGGALAAQGQTAMVQNLTATAFIIAAETAPAGTATALIASVTVAAQQTSAAQAITAQTATAIGQTTQQALAIEQQTAAAQQTVAAQQTADAAAQQQTVQAAQQQTADTEAQQNAAEQQQTVVAAEQAAAAAQQAVAAQQTAGAQQAADAAIQQTQAAAVQQTQAAAIRQTQIALTAEAESRTGRITFDAMNGTSITEARFLAGDEFLSRGIRLAGAPEDTYCADATKAAILLAQTYVGTVSNFLTTASPTNLKRCNTIPVEITFVQPVRRVALKYVGASVMYVMKVYDSSGNLLGTRNASATLNKGPFEVAFANPSASISRVTFGYQTAITAVTEIYYER
jgi:serine/threonine protein kinase